jgi:UDP-N-acetylglucosamine acyltransferase
MSIHPTACIDDSVDLGENVEVGPYAVLMGPSSVGDGCVFGPHAVLHPFVRLGKACRIHAGAVIGDVPQDVAFQGEESYVRIGDRCVFRECVTVHRGSKVGTETTIGDDCLLMVNSHVAHNCHVGNKVILVNDTLLAGHVTIQDGAFLAGNCSVHQFCRVGRLAMMGGHAAITQDLVPYCTTRPGRVNVIMGLNITGMRRAGLNSTLRSEAKRAYVLLFRSRLSVPQAVTRIREEFEQGPAREMADFADASHRGICTMRRSTRLE